MCSVSTEGAPPLRFLQGRAEMMPVLQDLLRSDGIDPDARAFPCPALHKEREGRGTHSVGDASKVKNLGHPPNVADCFDRLWPQRAHILSSTLRLDHNPRPHQIGDMF